jgi:hypothetical protein
MVARELCTLGARGITILGSGVRVPLAAKALNSIELDLLPLVTSDVTRLHLRRLFGNAASAAGHSGSFGAGRADS